MKPKELFSNLKTELSALVWTGTSNKIFGESVFFVPNVPEPIENHIAPTIFIVDEGARLYNHEMNLLEQAFTLAIYTRNEQDPFSESVMVGGCREASTSAGAGLLDIEQEVLEQLRGKTSLNSAKTTLIGTNKARVQKTPGSPVGWLRALSFSALVSSLTTPDEDEILRVPGSLYWGTVNIGAGNYGTRIGYLRDGIEYFTGAHYEYLSVEGTGVENSIKVYCGAKPRIIANLVNFNETVLSALFPGLSSAATHIIPNNFLAGSIVSEDTYCDDLLFLPDDSANNPCVYLRKAAPNLEKSFRFTRNQEAVYRCFFDSIRSGVTTSALSYVGLISGL